MVEKFIHAEPDGYGSERIECVAYTDYAALEARLASLDQKFMILQGSHDLLMKERDELKRRLAELVEFMKPDNGPISTIAIAKEDLWEDIIAIAEGRDNG